MPDEVENIIVVTAEKANGGGSGVRYDFRRMVDQQNRQPSNWQPTSPPPPYDSDPAPGEPGAAASVNVQITDSANEAEAIKAAENIAKAVTEIRAALEGLAPSTSVQWFSGGETMTAAQALSELNNTIFVVDDTTNYGNGGLGTAERGLSGAPNTVTLNFDAFDGDGGDYADPNYTNNQGVVGMMLHELGHVTQAARALTRYPN